jgi:predicted NUDIX family NTP pyrophosphohydrolase
VSGLFIRNFLHVVARVGKTVHCLDPHGISIRKSREEFTTKVIHHRSPSILAMLPSPNGRDGGLGGLTSPTLNIATRRRNTLKHLERSILYLRQSDRIKYHGHRKRWIGHFMPKSAGLLPYRMNRGDLEVFLVHPGGPFWASRDDGAWSIPKGEFADGEDPLEAAKREFFEETGLPVMGIFRPLDPIRQRGGKIVYAWSVLCEELNAAAITSNTFSLEWPAKSGRTQEFPEIDRAAWFPIETARSKILKSQLGLLDQLQDEVRR